MTQRMEDLLAQRATEGFVGRAAELNALHCILERDQPVVVHVHGIGGIGKSSLLEAFAEVARASNAVVVRLDCRSIEPTERGFLHVLDAAIGGEAATLEEAAERLGSLGKCVVLALDTYEVFRLMDTWLRRVFIPALPDRVRVVLCGREPPVAAWVVDPGWQDFFHSIRLESLSEYEAFDLLALVGVEAEAAHRLNRFAHGHPLALKLAAAALAGRPDLNLEEAVSQGVVEELIRVYLDDVRDPLTRDALDAASVVRRTTRSLLGAMLPAAAPQDAYERLQALPFVESGSDGLIVHDVVREVISTALRAADPTRYRALRHAAWDQLRSELATAGRAELWRYTADTLYLIENPVVREAFFPSDHQPLAVEPARSEDVSAICTIATECDGAEAAALVGRWWQCVPQAFYAIRTRHRSVTGFYFSFDPAEVPRAALKEDPVAQCMWQHLQEDPLPKKQRALIFRQWISEDQGEAPSPVQAAAWLDVKRTYLERRSYLRRVYCTVWEPQPYLEVMPTLGFQVLDERVELDGRTYFITVLDFGPSLVSGWLSGHVDAALGIEPDDILDVGARELVVDGRRAQLTKLEFEVMHYLCQHEGNVATRIAMLDEVWGIDYEGGSNVVDVVIRSLRKKLGPQAPLIETVTGMGYRFHRPSPPVAT